MGPVDTADAPSTLTPEPEPNDPRVSDTAPRVFRRPRVGRWIASIVVTLLAAGVVVSVATNPNFHWQVVGRYLFSPPILAGLVVTLQVTVVAMVIGILVGLLIGLMRLSSIPIVRSVAWFYVWLVRGVPVLVQLIFWYNIAALYPKLSIGISPLFDLGTIDANALITPFTAAIIGLGLNEGAYMSEIVRAGFLSVERGQTEAAQSLGLSRRRTILRVVLPQAMPAIIPPTGNQVIILLKTTALVSVLTLGDLLFAAQNIYARNFLTIPLLITVSIWYIVATSMLSIGQYYVERHFSRGRANANRPGPITHLRRSWAWGGSGVRRLTAAGRSGA